MKEIKQIIHAYELACKKQQKAALATVVHVAGSSYRAPGARMLITEDGMLTGAISGGCLEGDALRKALMVMMQGKPLLTTYDTSDEEDAVIGVGLGCNGIIRVLIEPILPEDPVNPIILLQHTLEKRQAVVLVTFFSLHNKWSEQQGTRLLLKADGALLKADNIIPAAINDAKNIKESIFIEYRDNGQPVSAFYEYIPPPVSIIVAGAGNDVLPLVQIGEVLGWDITLVDGRPAYANSQRFPACRVIVSDPESALRELVIDDQTAVVLMTHNYNYDKALLKALIAMPVNYIGMLGPRKKLSRMLTEFEEEGTKVTEEQLSRVYSPVGLDIGAETAEEIALAVLAEIKAVFAGRSGVYLRSFTGKMHERKTEIIAGTS
ncbi:XdhC family protein [Chitinophaga niabensis]|uniref:Xanthine and CO dehydrogenase maturation factor, XdhC/CoxF family n=1 Tax=Chitinophaga niabensis TaxID=536979 RepID=A0A1N6FWG6_9BACT|nr:XdhC/CoxI family protein [Chitinophaga niabensis]SIN99551.1 Xanthine and CO dehydrogenase maturation factor, XdhC/CoxF family [Chitinophaga niabensis]